MSYLQKRFLLVTLLLGAIGTVLSQRTTNSLPAVLKQIAAANIYEMSLTVGYAGTASQQFYRLQQLLRLALSKELIQIAAHHKNAVVRLYAYGALKQKKEVIPYRLTKKVLKDRTKVKVLYSCEASETTVAVLAVRDYQYDINNIGAMTNF